MTESEIQRRTRAIFNAAIRRGNRAIFNANAPVGGLPHGVAPLEGEGTMSNPSGDITKEALEARAEAYIEKRIASSGGVPFPFVGVQRTLCIKLMTGFACEVIIDEFAPHLNEEGETDAV